jgi:plastocyanin
MTIEQIHTHLQSGKTIHWENSLYHLHYVEAKEDNKSAKLSYKEGKAIRITCKNNGFGSLITESCLEKCFVTTEES